MLSESSRNSAKKWGQIQEIEAYLRIGYVYLILDEDEKANECYRKAKKVALKRGGKMQEEEEAISLSNRRQNVAGDACIHEYLDRCFVRSFVRSFVCSFN